MPDSASGAFSTFVNLESARSAVRERHTRPGRHRLPSRVWPHGPQIYPQRFLQFEQGKPWPGTTGGCSVGEGSPRLSEAMALWEQVWPSPLPTP